METERGSRDDTTQHCCRTCARSSERPMSRAPSNACLAPTFATLLLIIVFPGCSRTLTVTYTCDPEGAQLVNVGTGQSLGTCPMQVTYDIPWKGRADGY